MSPETPEITFKTISERDDLLAKVISLGDAHSKTLGMMPKGAFIHHAKQRTILTILYNSTFAGYLLYRISQRKRLVSITHLCIDPSFRSKGLPYRLLDQLKSKYEQFFQGMTLTCREDYITPSKLWEKYGFKPVHRKRSRSKEEHYLINWRYDFGNPDLFTHPDLPDSRISAVLDCCVLIPIRDASPELQGEAQSLFADWLQEDVSLKFAPETYNEINRDQDKQRAERTRLFLGRFEEISFKPSLRDAVTSALEHLRPGTTPNDVSDRKQLAECIASGTKFFITLDQQILDIADEIFKKYSVQIITPVDFILMVDEINNSLDYHSFRLAGADYEKAKIKQDELDGFLDAFSGIHKDEKKSDIREVVVKCLSDIKNGKVNLVSDATKTPIAAYATIRRESIFSVEFLRTKKLSFADVLFQQLLKDIIMESLNAGVSLISIQERQLTNAQKSILVNMGFRNTEGRWLKVCLRGMLNIEHLLSLKEVEILDPPSIRAKLNAAPSDEYRELLKLELERKLWPLKITDITIPVYIIPIKPFWAGQLFDYFIANSGLFAAKESLSWSRENVYYRSVRPVSEKVPARLLWYVSSKQNTATGRQRGIVGCSYLDDVCVDRVKTVFQKFKRFGVYQWKEVYKLANHQLMSEIKALKFSDTEVFENIVPLEVINSIMTSHQMAKNTFASPVEVSTEIFNDIYRLGINE